MSTALTAWWIGPGAPHWRPSGPSFAISARCASAGSAGRVPSSSGATPSLIVAMRSRQAQDG